MAGARSTKMIGVRIVGPNGEVRFSCGIFRKRKQKRKKRKLKKEEKVPKTL